MMDDRHCEHVRQIAAEVALDALPGDERATVLVHLDECTACRDLVDDLSRVADDVLTALPAADVSPQLQRRLRDDARAAMSGAPQRYRWQPLAAAAVALIIAAGVIIAGVRSADAPDPGVDEFALVAPDGASIGNVEITADQTPPQITMRVEQGAGDAMFRCVAVLDDGASVDIGYLQIEDGEGEWTGDLDQPPDRIAEVEIVDDTGRAVATATID